MAIKKWQPRTGLIPSNPFGALEELERNFEDIFGHHFLPSVWQRSPAEEMGWAPPIELFEKGNKLVVKAELPGMKEEDIDISIVGDTLTIKGERKTESEVKKEDYYYCERSYGNFSRSINIPSDVDANKIEASYEGGVLEINLPKVPEAKAKKIIVSTKKKNKADK